MSASALNHRVNWLFVLKGVNLLVEVQATLFFNVAAHSSVTFTYRRQEPYTAQNNNNNLIFNQGVVGRPWHILGTGTS